jgi:hypothetical protein
MAIQQIIKGNYGTPGTVVQQWDNPNIPGGPPGAPQGAWDPKNPWANTNDIPKPPPPPLPAPPAKTGNAPSNQVKAQLTSLLTNYGLSTLSGPAYQLFLDGKSMDEILLWLRDQPEFQQKYSAIFAREKAGLPPVSVQDILNYQSQALALEHQYGIPANFVDVNNLIAKDVSINELGQRVQLADNLVSQHSDAVQQLQQLYGLNSGALVAFALDPNTGLPAVQREFASAQIAANAKRASFGQLTAPEAEGLYGQGVSSGQAQSGFDTLYQNREVTQQLQGETTPGMTRQSELGFVAGDAASSAELQRRAAQRTSVFQEGGGPLMGQGGVFGSGAATPR